MQYVKLEKDVKEFVQNKIKNVSSVDELFSFFDFTVNDSNPNSDCLRHLDRFKKVLQLTINAFNNRDMTENFGSQFELEDTNCLHSLESHYVSDESGCLWRCLGRPTIGHVQDALYNYVLCFLLSQKIKKKTIVICSFCDTAIVQGETKCSACDESVENILKSLGEGAMTGAQNRKEERSPKWKCGCLKEYSFVRCVQCSGRSKQAWWHCGPCSTENSCAFELCVVCGNAVVYGDVVDAVDHGTAMGAGALLICPCCSSLGVADVEHCPVCNSLPPEVAPDHWRCGDCNSLHDYSATSCGACGSTRAEKGVWACTKCTLVNRCTRVMCEVCNATNDHLTAKLCTERGSVHGEGGRGPAKGGQGQWRCTFIKCRDTNVPADLFCRICGLYRDFSHNRGDMVRQWTKAGDLDIWICHKCFKMNPLQESLCCGCRGTRFEMKYCYKCQQYKEGSLYNCDKCQQRF